METSECQLLENLPNFGGKSGGFGQNPRNREKTPKIGGSGNPDCHKNNIEGSTFIPKYSETVTIQTYKIIEITGLLGEFQNGFRKGRQANASYLE